MAAKAAAPPIPPTVAITAPIAAGPIPRVDTVIAAAAANPAAISKPPIILLTILAALLEPSLVPKSSI